MPFAVALRDADRRAQVAADAISEAEAAVNERTGLRGMSAQLGLETINRLRPGFLERHVYNMLPAMAIAMAPYWHAGIAAGDACGHLEANADSVSASLLEVADGYVATATDTKAVAVYQQLRQRAPQRIAEQMPRIAEFVERHTQTDGPNGSRKPTRRR